MHYHGHFVQFFDADERLAGAVSDFFAQALRSSHSCIMVATEVHRTMIRRQLIAMGFDVDALQATCQFVLLDAATMLATFTVDGKPERVRFHEAIGRLVRQVSVTGRPVSIYGEMVGLLAAAGRHAETLQLEELWNELGREENFTLFCGYSQPDQLGAELLARICNTHTDVLTAR